MAECPMIPYKANNECGVFCAWYDAEYNKCAMLLMAKQLETITVVLEELKHVVQIK